MRACSFVCYNGLCKSGLSSTKTKFEWIKRDTRGFNTVFSFTSFSFCCAIYGTNVQIERTRKDSLRAYESPSIDSIVTNYVTFKLSKCFLWRMKINYRRFLDRLSTNLMTLFFIPSVGTVFSMRTDLSWWITTLFFFKLNEIPSERTRMI